jgi:hypothetical protein
MSNDQDGGPHGKMRTAPGAPPGIELDGKGNVIPLAERTKGDQEKARAGQGSTKGSIKDPMQEAEHPAPMPPGQQGQGGAPKDTDSEGQQGAVKR